MSVFCQTAEWNTFLASLAALNMGLGVVTFQITDSVLSGDDLVSLTTIFFLSN